VQLKEQNKELKVAFSLGKVSLPVGLDIGSNRIKVVQLKPATPNPLLLKYGIADAPVDSVVDGEINDTEAVAQTISDLLYSSGISEKRVILGISNQKIIVRVISVPYMEKDELRSAIEFQAGDHIPIPIDQAIIDFVVVGERQNEKNERLLDIILVAAQKEMVAKHIEALEKAKLKPYIVDVSSFAIARSLIEPPALVPEEKDIEKAKKAVGLVDIGDEVTNITIVENGILRFSRITSVADNTFTKALVTHLNLSVEDAIKNKDKYGFAPVGSAKAEATDDPQEKVQAVLADELLKFVSEVKRSFDYGLAESLESEKIDRIILSGVGAKTPGLLSYFEESFGLEVTLGNPLGSVSLADSINQEQASEHNLQLAISLGLALRGIEE